MKKQYPSAEFVLDLDDYESLTWKRIKKIYKLNGDQRSYRFAALREEAFRQVEKRSLPAFDRVYVCSECDKKKVEQAYQLHNIHYLPNIYLPREITGTKTRKKHGNAGTFCYIWVSSWGYYPNLDSLLFFSREILPILREKHSTPFVVQVIGQGKLPEDVQQRLSAEKEMVYIGEVDKIDQYYQQADAALAPLRAGGGTRLKVLEAFAYGVPVIATSIGVEGLEIVNGKQALIADNPSDFAGQCMRLNEDANLRHTLIQHASILLKEKYSPDRLKEILCDLSS